MLSTAYNANILQNWHHIYAFYHSGYPKLAALVVIFKIF